MYVSRNHLACMWQWAGCVCVCVQDGETLAAKPLAENARAIKPKEPPLVSLSLSLFLALLFPFVLPSLSTQQPLAAFTLLHLLHVSCLVELEHYETGSKK